MGQSIALLRRREIYQPVDHVDDVLEFADGTSGRVYRETMRRHSPTSDPALLVVGFRLRGIHGWAHGLFRAESLVNTPLFVGFPGFVSKLWLAHDEGGLYRGVYQWDGGSAAHSYVRALWWVLALVSVRGSIHYAVIPGVRRDDVLADPSVMGPPGPATMSAWWRLTAVRPRGAGEREPTREPNR